MCDLRAFIALVIGTENILADCRVDHYENGFDVRRLRRGYWG